MADAIDDAMERGEATTDGTKNERRYQVGNATIPGAEVDRWRKLRAIPDEERESTRQGRNDYNAGEMLAEMDKHDGDPRSHDVTRLADLGITKMQSSRWQEAANAAAIRRAIEKFFSAYLLKTPCRFSIARQHLRTNCFPGETYKRRGLLAKTAAFFQK